MTDTGFRITYATMSADDGALHTAYDEGIASARLRLGMDHSFIVDGEPRTGDGVFEEYSPIDRSIVVGRFGQAAARDVEDAVTSAAASFPTWASTTWQERVTILLDAADRISENRFTLAALMAFEIGKNRLEALGEVEESADLIRYYCHEMQTNDGFVTPMHRLSPNEATFDVMRPYGVWAVISPFNFPMALSGGPVGAALVAGNTVVLKPSNTGALIGIELGAILHDAGVPAGVFHVITGSGSVAGAALVAHPDVAGMTFTGSYDVGMNIYRRFARDWPKPAICEMGGKNPVVVSRKADVELAATGITRSAFGYGGQKCSAASRVYAEQPVFDELVAAVSEQAAGLALGNPLDRDVYLGPVIDEAAGGRFDDAVAEARRVGTVHSGGTRIVDGDLERGTYLAPTVVTADPSSWIWRRELFVPFVAMAPIATIEDGIAKANDTEYGLTAGFFSADDGEVERFLAGIHAGVVYVNRKAGATTGAWPAVQPFGGWKGSGTGGKAGGGPYYVTQYLREQSRTIVGT